MRKLNIAIFASGNGSNFQNLIEAEKLEFINGKISLVVSSVKDAYALKRAETERIDAVYVKKDEFFSKTTLKLLREKEIDLIVLAGFTSALEKDIVSLYRDRIINIHPSLIPSFCGSGFYGKRVHHAVLEYGVKITGATTHFVDENIDSGPIIMQEPVEVNTEDTVESLSEKVLKVEHELLLETVRLYCLGKLSVSERKVYIKNSVDN